MELENNRRIQEWNEMTFEANMNRYRARMDELRPKIEKEKRKLHKHHPDKYWSLEEKSVHAEKYK